MVLKGMSRILRGDESEKLNAALLSAFPTRAALKRFARFNLGVSLDAIDDGSSYQDSVFSFVEWAESEGRIVALLESAIKEQPKNVLLGAISSALLDGLKIRAKALGTSIDPYESWLLNRGEPFLNRTALRAFVRELASNGSRILVVDGPPSSGKTYTLNYISHILDVLPDHRIVVVDADHAIRATFTPDQVAVSIVSQIGRRSSIEYMPKQAELQAARWLQDVRDWIVGEINQTSVTWWVIFDGLCAAEVPPATRELLKHLIRSAHLYVPQLRVVVLAYSDEVLPLDIAAFIRKERISVIGKPEIDEYFNRLQTALSIDSAKVGLASQNVYKVFESGGTSLSQVNAAVVIATQTLKAGSREK